MKKGVLSIFLIASIIMVPLLSFEVSALTSYGQPCAANSDCTSGVCDYIWDASDGRKECKCATKSDCPYRDECEPITKKCKIAYGESCTESPLCASGVCGNSAGSGLCGCSSDANCLPTQLCVTASNDCKTKNGAACNPAYPALCASGYCNPTTRVCGAAPAGGDSSGSGTAARCSTNAECASGQTCAATSWVHSPTRLKDNGAECDSYTECKSGTCVARSGAKGTCAECSVEGVRRCGFTGATCTARVCKANTNARCYDDLNCKSGFCSRFPKNTKSGICSTRCTSDAGCTAGNKCNINSGVCERGVCQTAGAAGGGSDAGAAARCSTNAECGAGKECVGRSWIPAQRQMKINGAECGNYQECATGVCIPRSSGGGTCAACTAEGIARCKTNERCGSLGICQAIDGAQPCFSPLRCQSGFCSKIKDSERGVCLAQSAKCTSDAGCPAGNKCNAIAGICEIRGECRTIAAPAGGDTDTCSTLAGADRISCEINALITNMRARAGAL